MLRVLKSIFIAATLGLGAMAASQQVPADQLIFGNEGDNDIEVKAFDKPALSDLLTVEPRLSVFYDYLRQSETLVKRLTSNTPTTIFAPQDSAILALQRKPHQGPAANPGNLERLSEEEEEKEMLAYLEKWTEAYMVDGSDFELEAGTSVTTLAGQEHKLTFADGSEGGGEQWQNILVQPGDAKIITAKEARDGRLYVIDRILQ